MRRGAGQTCGEKVCARQVGISGWEAHVKVDVEVIQKVGFMRIGRKMPKDYCYEGLIIRVETFSVHILRMVLLVL